MIVFLTFWLLKVNFFGWAELECSIKPFRVPILDPTEEHLNFIYF